MSKRRSAVCSSTFSSSTVSRSINSVASPPLRNSRATYWLRGLWRLLPLPWEKKTTPFAPSVTPMLPSSVTPPVSTRTTSEPLFSRSIVLVPSQAEAGGSVLVLGWRGAATPPQDKYAVRIRYQVLDGSTQCFHWLLAVYRGLVATCVAQRNRKVSGTRHPAFTFYNLGGNL